MKTTRNYNRKPVKASTESDLLRKVHESEMRGWTLLGYGQQSNGRWFAVMERARKKII